MSWIGTTCMSKMIELHSRVKVALSSQVVKLIFEFNVDVDYEVEYIDVK